MTRSLKRRLSRNLGTACTVLTMSCMEWCQGPSPGPAPTPAPGPSSTESSDITVTFTGTTSTDPVLLLYSGMETGVCTSYKSSVGTPTVTLDDVSLDSSCRVEVEAFAPEVGAFAKDVDPLDPSSDDWFVNAIASGALTVTMPGRTTIPLRIWIVSPAGGVPTVEAVRDRLLNKAYPLLDALATGLTLDTASATLSPSALTANCTSADVIAANPAIYDASRVNVYFVSYYGNHQGLSPARNCWLFSHPEIIFISFSDPNVTDPTLAHELGHALGLIHPRAQYGGHTYPDEGFDPFNLMASNADVKSATIGQLYAMNFSSDSWINRAGSPLAKPVVRTCQDSWGPGQCPALTLVQPGWPP